jgi:gamma-glutamyltranspeptidase/glutathione hydrolase
MKKRNSLGSSARWVMAAMAPIVVARIAPAGQEVDRRNAESREGMVVSASTDASDAGAAILARGGNAVDAAIAVAFAMAVTHPTAGNIGGGGFMLVHPSDGSPPLFIDYREKAPLVSTLEMYAEGGRRNNVKWVGVPGTVRGMKLAHEIYGTIDWADLVEPAVRLASDGFIMGDGLARSLNGQVRGSNNDEFKRVYGKPDGEQWRGGDRIVMPDLGRTLARIAERGTDGFYKGETAELLVKEMERGGGYIAMEDLARYRARVRQPIQFSYRGYEVLSAPPPSSGGITLAQMLQILETHDLKSMGRWSKEANHLIVEAMKRAYANRAMHLGDPDFVEIPAHLTTKAFAKEMAAGISMEKATPSETLGPPITEGDESPETTHFSVIDKSGMAVSNTYTLEAGYGSGVVVTGGGFILNNEMGDFNPRPGVTTRTGTIGTPPNLIAPEKRMLSSMTPTIVTRDGKPYLVTGSPGGRTIINTVLCVVLNVLEFDMSLREAIDAPRTDHEWFPERVSFVGANDPQHAEMVAALRALGHDVRDSGGQGDANSILVRDGSFIGAADGWGGGASAPGGK